MPPDWFSLSQTTAYWSQQSIDHVLCSSCQRHAVDRTIWLSSLKLLLKWKQSKTTQRLLASMDLVSPWSVAGAEIRGNLSTVSWRCRQNAQLWVALPQSILSWTSSYWSGLPSKEIKVSKCLMLICVEIVYLLLKERKVKNVISCRHIHEHKRTWVSFSMHGNWRFYWLDLHIFITN